MITKKENKFPEKYPEKYPGKYPEKYPIEKYPQFNQKDTTFCKAYQGDYGEEIKKIWAMDYSKDPLMSSLFGYNDMSNCLSWYLAKATNGPVRYELRKKAEPNPKEFTKIVKEMAKYFGAEKVGICELQPYHMYSHKAQKIDTLEGNWGDPVELNHKYAISMVFPLDHQMMNATPSFVDEAEIGWAYHKAAVLCCELAAFIRESGYSAMGHHHRRDYVIHVPVAIDAGLGELGRNGYLITPEWGPCCRITTVTTELPLIPDQPVDYGVDYFCKICKKCANNCPSRAIPTGDKTVIRGFEKWQLNADACFKFWLSKPEKWFGCAVCMKSCPWNRKNTWYHKLSVKIAAKYHWFSHILLWLDDMVNGKHPKFNVKWIDYSAMDRSVDEINKNGGSKDQASEIS